MEVQSGFVPVAGARLSYAVTGRGRTLVLIHAGIADQRMWDEQAAAFAKHFRVVRYDLRGFGRSQTEDVEFTHRGDLRVLLRHLGIEKAALCGVSLGGQIAIDFTLESPHVVEALIPVAAGVSGYKPGEKARPIETEMFAAMEAAWEARDFERLIELEVQMWVDGPGQPPGRADPRVAERVRLMERETIAANSTEGKPQPLTPPAIERLEEIRAPTLVCVGDLDTSAVVATAEIMAERIPGARRAVFPGTAHMLAMERPAEFNRAVLDFLGTAFPG